MRMPLNKFSQHQKILTIMCRNQDQRWWFAYDFMKSSWGPMFVGYEASARLTELSKRYPNMVETEQAGKYKKRRLRFEEIDLWLPKLPKDLRYAIHRAGLSYNKELSGPGDGTIETRPQPSVMNIISIPKPRKRPVQATLL